MDIQKIADIQELKALKADQYDIKEQLEARYAQTKQNIANLNVRINELSKDKEGSKDERQSETKTGK